MKKFIWIFILLLGATLIFGMSLVFFPVFKGSNAILKVETKNTKVRVYLNDKLLGNTPYLNQRLTAGDHRLKLVGELSGSTIKKVEFSTSISLTPQTITAVNYEFGPNQKFSSGDIRSQREGSAISIITSPTAATVWLDGEKIGTGPLSTNPSQGIHKLKVAKDGFVTRELEINVEHNFRLVIEVFLAENPFEQVEKISEGQPTIFRLYTNQDSLLADPAAWSEGIFFFKKAAGYAFDALIAQNGKVYYEDKKTFSEKVAGDSLIVVGLLLSTENKEPTSEAVAALEKLKPSIAPKPPVPTGPQVEILSTPTGTLNVRSGPGTSFSTVTKVNPGEKYELLEESSGWYKIKVSGQSGWVSTQYAKKL